MTFALAALGCAIFFAIICTAATMSWIRVAPSPTTKQLREGLTALAILAGMVTAAFVIAAFFLWAAGV